MGREVRRVPPSWAHPQEERFDPFRRVTETRYVPLYDRDAETAWAQWQAEYAKWLGNGHDGGEFARVRAEHPDLNYSADEPYRAFCSWHGQPPDPSRHRPKWPAGSATWWQVYETVSEGTPVTPPFATPEELVNYLATHGDFWDQRRRAEGRTSMPCGPWPREHAEAFVKRGWAPSVVVVTSPEGAEVKTPRDGA